MKRWCLGLIFDQTLNFVVLLRKGRTLHVGLWNGIGGVIENTEATEGAMTREAYEEGQYRIDPVDWVKIGTIRGSNLQHGGPWSVTVFAVQKEGHLEELANTIVGLQVSEESMAKIPSDEAVAVPVAKLPDLDLAPHTHLFVLGAIAKLRDRSRPEIHVTEP